MGIKSDHLQKKVSVYSNGMRLQTFSDEIGNYFCMLYFIYFVWIFMVVAPYFTWQAYALLLFAMCVILI